LNFVISQRCGADIAFFLQDLDGGGAERAIVALAGEIAKQGCTADFVVGDGASDYRSEVSSEVHVHDFATRSSLLVFCRLVAYLRRRSPAVVMSALDACNIMLVVAAGLAGYKGRTIISQRAVVIASHDELTPFRRMLTRLLQRLFFRHADALISNSHAAASEVQALLGVPADKIVTIHNAVDADRINRLASEPHSDHLFLKDQAPLIVSVGSLTKRKDMGTLIKAFAAVKAQRQAHLVIIGKGPEGHKIESLISDLGLSANAHLPGFDANPYKWMAAAAVFVSSSTAEGFPNVIAEALALGRSIVATDCPGDTAELLGHGKWGRLVPVGDPERMAGAILAALDDPNPPNGRIRAADFSPANTVGAYLKVLLPALDTEASRLRQSQ
jgi:glycosyltransferase involved in cell wall biosynthesis